MDGTAEKQQVDSDVGAPTAKKERSQRIFGWFGKILPPGFFESLKQDLDIVENSCIFTLTVTSWLMIMQRLSPGGTLATAVSDLIHGSGRELLEPCKQVREENISAGTGADSQARQRIPVKAARRIAERTFEQLHVIASGHGLRDRLFLPDGSSIRLAHTPALRKAYPEAENQHGKSHWPVMRVAVMHHIVTALAMAPEFGPMYGSKAVSEQGLAGTLIDGLPDSSVLIGDRNFGVFSVAWRAHSRGHRVVTRLTEARANRLSGGNLSVGSDRKVTWQPSRDDLRAHPEFSAEARIDGRLIVVQSMDEKEILYLFTTLEERSKR